MKVAPILDRFGEFDGLLSETNDETGFKLLRQSETIGRPLGSETWIEQLKKMTGKVLKPGKRGPKTKDRDGEHALQEIRAGHHWGQRHQEGYAMNINAIAAAIEQDAGEPLPGLRDSLAEMQAGLSGRTYTPEQLLVKAARERLGLSQHAFAELIDTPVATLRDWEQGRFAPPGAARRLLEIALRHPEVLTERAA